MDDNDMKIFGNKPVDETIDEVALIAEMDAQRSNGNTDKAKQLSQKLAGMFLNEKELHVALTGEIGEYNYPKQIVFQMKILMFFTAEYCINRALPNMLLKTTAINTLYDCVMSGDRDFYEEFSDGIEYSFYYLAVKKGSMVKEIGKTFAMVCGKENDSEFTRFGENLFTVVEHEVEKIIDSFSFIR